MSNGQLVLCILFMEKDHAWTGCKTGTIPDPSRKRPSRHVKGTRVSACANRSLAFSYVPSGKFSTIPRIRFQSRVLIIIVIHNLIFSIELLVTTLFTDLECVHVLFCLLFFSLFTVRVLNVLANTH